MNPWQLYDDLIDLVPSDRKVTVAVSARWSYVATDDGLHGIAMTLDSPPSHHRGLPEVIGTSLRDVAALVKSWDLRLASLGTAALTCALNTESRLQPLKHEIPPPGVSTFGLRADRMAGKRVGVIGRFPDLQAHAERCELTVLERNPGEYDLPDPACEYVLADQDEVFITGTTVTNKTLPRLLQLCSSARVTLVGPSVPLAPEVYGDCVAEVGGALVASPSGVRAATELGGAIPQMRDHLTFFNATTTPSRDNLGPA